MRSPILASKPFEWLLLAFAATLAPYTLWLPLWYSALLYGVLAARLIQRRRFARPWPAWVKFPLLAAVLVLVVWEFGDPRARQTGTAALLGLTALKLIEAERRRDGFLTATVCLFLVSVQFLFEQGIGVTAYMVVPTLLCFVALNECAAPPGTRGGISEEFGRIGRELGLLLLVALPLTVFLFVSTPRLSSPLWGTLDASNEARTGLSGTMSPGSITELIADDSPVMRVTFAGERPDRASLYWRGPVLWRFDGIEWRASSSFLGRSDARTAGPTPAGAEDLRYRVLLEPTDRRWLFMLDYASGIPGDSVRLLDGQVIRDAPVKQVLAYEGSAALDAPLPPGPFVDEQRLEALRLPPQRNPETIALARQWRDEIGNNPLAIAGRALLHFREEPFAYSLSPPPLSRVDRVDQFLFDTRSGFCEHYAAAFVVLMRAADVPARVVTGYQGGTWNPIGEYLLVRNSDAHAWAEVLVPDQGWVRIDPTAAIAPERVDLGGQAFIEPSVWSSGGWLEGVAIRFDALRAWWNEAVVRFDHASQRRFFEHLGLDIDDWRQTGLWFGIGLVAVSLLSGLVFWHRRGAGGDPRSRQYQRVLARLGRLGLSTPASEGPRTLAARVRRERPDLAGLLDPVCEAYEACRYGAPDTADDAALRAAVAAFMAGTPRR
jgi:transglutaminase-like putative cysteine protease